MISLDNHFLNYAIEYTYISLKYAILAIFYEKKVSPPFSSKGRKS